MCHANCPVKDQEVVAKLAELDMIAAELEAATSRVATVERRNVCSTVMQTFAILMISLEGNLAGRDRKHEER